MCRCALISRGSSSLENIPLWTHQGSARGNQKLTLAVKEYAEGKVSSRLAAVQPGDMVEMRGLFGRLTLAIGPKGLTVRDRDLDISEKARALVFLTGGSGITPAIQCIKAIGESGSNDIECTLICSSRRASEFLCLDELSHFQSHFPWVSILLLVQDGDTAAELSARNFTVRVARASAQSLRDIIPASNLHGGCAALICGPPSFDDAIRAMMMHEFGYPRDAVHVF